MALSTHTPEGLPRRFWNLTGSSQGSGAEENQSKQASRVSKEQIGTHDLGRQIWARRRVCIANRVLGVTMDPVLNSSAWQSPSVFDRPIVPLLSTCLDSPCFP